MHPRSFETPSLPSSLAATHRGFAFYACHAVALAKAGRSSHSLHSTCRFAHLWHAVASAKAGRSRPRGSILAPSLVTYVDHSVAAATSRQLPSCVAVYPRD